MICDRVSQKRHLAVKSETTAGMTSSGEYFNDSVGGFSFAAGAEIRFLAVEISDCAGRK